MEVEGEVIHFGIFKAMRHPDSGSEIQAMDIIDDLMGEINLNN